MKKVPLLLFALLPCAALTGADFSLSAGGGALLGGLFTGYTLNGQGNLAGPVDIHSRQEVNQFNYGASLFFDAAWAELSVHFQQGRDRFLEHMSMSGEEPVDVDTSGRDRESALGLSLLGKYPFPLGGRFTLFPLAGLEYRIALRERRQQGNLRERDRTDGVLELDQNNEAYRLGMWNALFIDIGGGFDFAFRPPLFLRTELLYGFRLQTPYEKDALEKVKKMTGLSDPKLRGLTSGPTLKMSVGYRFGKIGG